MQNNNPKHFLSEEEFVQLRVELAKANAVTVNEDGEEATPAEPEGLPAGTEDLPDPAKVRLCCLTFRGVDVPQHTRELGRRPLSLYHHPWRHHPWGETQICAGVFPSAAKPMSTWASSSQGFGMDKSWLAGLVEWPLLVLSSPQHQDWPTDRVDMVHILPRGGPRSLGRPPSTGRAPACLWLSFSLRVM